MKLFVSNIHFDATEQALREFFGNAGYTVLDLVVRTKETERGKRRFAFVEIADGQADDAIDELDGSEFMDRRLNVQRARPVETRETRRSRGATST